MTMPPLSIAVLTCSDTRTLEEDTAGAALEEECRSLGWEFRSREVVKDTAEAISSAIKRLAMRVAWTLCSHAAARGSDLGT